MGPLNGRSSCLLEMFATDSVTAGLVRENQRTEGGKRVLLTGTDGTTSRLGKLGTGGGFPYQQYVHTDSDENLGN